MSTEQHTELPREAAATAAHQYYEGLPDEDEIVMCTITSFTPEVGFNAVLEGYIHDGRPLTGLLSIPELSNRRIRKNPASVLKIGTEIPLMVLDNDPAAILLSKKYVKQPQAETCRDLHRLYTKLFGTIQRLVPMTGIPAQEWQEAFVALDKADSPEEHPWNLLSSRDCEPPELEARYLQAIRDNHTKLFGIKPIERTHSITIQSLAIDGNQRVRDALTSLLTDKTWTTEELYADQTRYNLILVPIAIPKFQLKITAYLSSRCEEVLETLKSRLESQGFDYLQIN